MPILQFGEHHQINHSPHYYAEKQSLHTTNKAHFQKSVNKTIKNKKNQELTNNHKTANTKTQKQMKATINIF